MKAILENGEQFEKYTSQITKKSYYQYDYRWSGRLFTCCAKSLEEARQKRDEWKKNLA